MRIYNTSIGGAFWIIGVIVVLLGLFVGYANGNVTDPVTLMPHQNWSITWSIWIPSVTGGIFMLGISEIIKYLYNIYLNTRPAERVVSATGVSKEA
jgi:hypothetical protein